MRLENYSVEEIADHFNFSVRTVGRRLRGDLYLLLEHDRPHQANSIKRARVPMIPDL